MDLPWAPEGRAEYNRAAFLNLLGTLWLPAIADVDSRLRREPPPERQVGVIYPPPGIGQMVLRRSRTVVWLG